MFFPSQAIGEAFDLTVADDSLALHECMWFARPWVVLKRRRHRGHWKGFAGSTPQFPGSTTSTGAFEFSFWFNRRWLPFKTCKKQNKMSFPQHPHIIPNLNTRDLNDRKQKTGDPCVCFSTIHSSTPFTLILPQFAYFSLIRSSESSRPQTWETNPRQTLNTLYRYCTNC